MPEGQYKVDGARIESAHASDDNRYTVLTVRLDLPAGKTGKVRAHP